MVLPLPALLLQPTDILRSIPFLFIHIRNSFAQRSPHNFFLINHFRTLSHGTEGGGQPCRARGIPRLHESQVTMLQNRPFIINNLPDAPPPTSSLSWFCIVAGEWVYPHGPRTSSITLAWPPIFGTRSCHPSEFSLLSKPPFAPQTGEKRENIRAASTLLFRFLPLVIPSEARLLRSGLFGGARNPGWTQTQARSLRTTHVSARVRPCLFCFLPSAFCLLCDCYTLFLPILCPTAKVRRARPATSARLASRRSQRSP